jgi:hypothetical protein
MGLVLWNRSCVDTGLAHCLGISPSPREANEGRSVSEMTFRDMGLRRIAILFFLCLAQSCLAQGLYVHSESNLRFPGKLAGFQQGRVHTYDDPGLGISVNYVFEGLGKADLYIYDLGQKTIPSGVGSDLVRSVFGSADRDITSQQQNGFYFDLERLLPLGAVLDASNAGQKLYISSYKFRVGDMRAEPLVSWLVVTGYRNRFFKIRFSHAGDRAADGQAALYGLIDAFFDANKEGQ